jgi:hypothetical protein
MSKTPAAVLAALTLSLGVAACQTATPYQPNIRGQQASGGYSELRLEPDRWRVTFTGNGVTSRETVEGYLLFRAAELTVQSGADWFEIVDRGTDKKTRTYVDPDPFYHPWYGGYGYWRPSWRYRTSGFGWRTWDPFWGDPFFAYGYDVHTIESYEAAAEIMTHHGTKPQGDPRAFDAHAVIENLKPRILYPGAKTQEAQAK